MTQERGPGGAPRRPARSGSRPAAPSPQAKLLPLPPPGQDELGPDLLELVRRYTATLPAPRTRVEYGKALRDFLMGTGIRTLGALLLTTSHQVTEYRNRLQARGLSPATIKVRLSAVSGMFAALVQEGRLPGNPADPRVVRRLRLSEVSRTEGLSPEEVRAMIRTCDRASLAGLRDRAILVTLFYEGLRRSEVSNLVWRDLTVRKGLLEVRGGKTSSYDAVRLHPAVWRAIEEYHATRNRELGRRETAPAEPVFGSLSPASHDKPLSPTAVNEIVKARARKAGIKRPVSAHSMRHACTTAALAAGVPLHQVQRHLRHKDVRTTLRYDRDRCHWSGYGRPLRERV